MIFLISSDNLVKGQDVYSEQNNEMEIHHEFEIDFTTFDEFFSWAESIRLFKYASMLENKYSTHDFGATADESVGFDIPDAGYLGHTLKIVAAWKNFFKHYDKLKSSTIFVESYPID